MHNFAPKRILTLALAAFFLLGMVGETIAYATWSQTVQTTNEYQPGTYSTNLEEAFNSPSDWMPGATTNKDVWVSNSGSVPVFTYVVVSQSWVANQIDDSSTYDLVFTTADGMQEYAALIDWGDNVVLLASGVSEDANTPSLGLDTVESVAAAAGKWLLLREVPDANGDFTFYYIGMLEAGGETPFLIDGVQMNPNIQAEILSQHTVWEKDESTGVWTSSTTTTYNPSGSYQNATYTLTPTMHTVQATNAALADEWAGQSATVVTHLQTFATTGMGETTSRDDNVTTKMVYLNEDGVLSYDPYGAGDDLATTPEENWFMSFFNMMPGETYTDTLSVQNLGDEPYTLYMQAVAWDVQADVAEALLQYITLTVTYDGTEIYEGTVDGYTVDSNGTTLYNVVCLGAYAAGDDAKEISVRLTLDKDLPLDYAGVLANTDWQFMVLKTEVSAEPTPTPTATASPTAVPTATVAITVVESSPVTGEQFAFGLYLCAMAVSACGFMLSVRTLKDGTLGKQ